MDSSGSESQNSGTVKETCETFISCLDGFQSARMSFEPLENWLFVRKAEGSKEYLSDNDSEGSEPCNDENDVNSYVSEDETGNEHGIASVTSGSDDDDGSDIFSGYRSEPNLVASARCDVVDESCDSDNVNANDTCEFSEVPTETSIQPQLSDHERESLSFDTVFSRSNLLTKRSRKSSEQANVNSSGFTDISPVKKRRSNSECTIKDIGAFQLDRFTKQPKMRERISQELLDTEETYHRHLELIVEHFEDPLQNSGLLPDGVISSIFGEIRQIIAVNNELMKRLQSMNIGQAFLQLGPFLKLYSTYANNHERALATLLEWEQKCPEFAKFRRRQEALSDMKGLKLNALLITPVQRIPRYKLLLSELLDNTPFSDPDYKSLEEAYSQVSAVASHINDHIKQQDSFMRMLAIQRSLACPVGPRIVAPGRVFIKEGQLKKVSKRGSLGRSYDRTFFLFSDILMYAKPRLLEGAANVSMRSWVGGSGRLSATPSLVCCCIFPLHHCRVERVLGHGGSEQGALFTISCKQESLLLYSDQKTVSNWIDAINKAIVECKANRQSLRKTSSAKRPLRRSGITKLLKAEKQNDRLFTAVCSPEKSWKRSSELNSSSHSNSSSIRSPGPGGLFSRFMSASDKSQSPSSAKSKSAQKLRHMDESSVNIGCFSARSAKTSSHNRNILNCLSPKHDSNTKY